MYETVAWNLHVMLRKIEAKIYSNLLLGAYPPGSKFTNM